ncbi:AbrB family transcriptional regulator [Roseicyclus sp. F158]|uniref:AbrB family transcriptional regulator n=1 Tax=Tropicimonas omnivorans TaxID=3075590 RepID=A0ABU3DCK2_9RHOB|nr:AbrB family transcriptional regulator [Roseicyclus sp. F158]MDT0681441.1 AbrB family transcriptional regulator [Roseicyclus sp. F158]
MRQDKAQTQPALRTVLFRRGATLAMALAGAALFSWLHLPLPFLFGPMTACLVTALLGVPLSHFSLVSRGARTILGAAVGASITPAVMHQIPSMLGSVMFVPLFVAIIGAVGVPYFRKVCGFDLATSYYAAMPGGLQDMVLFGEEAGADVRALSLIHATRVLIVVTIVPIVMTQAFDLSLRGSLGDSASAIPPLELFLMATACLVGWLGGQRLGLFGAPILGPLILTAALSLGGMIQHRPPSEAILAAQFFIGTGIGVGYVGVTMRELRKDVLAGVVFVLILAVLTFGITEIVVQLGFATPLSAFLSFAPGGQAEMAVLAIIAGADLGFIVVHHLARITLIITGAPIVAAALRVKERRSAASEGHDR